MHKQFSKETRTMLADSQVGGKTGSPDGLGSQALWLQMYTAEIFV